MEFKVGDLVGVYWQPKNKHNLAIIIKEKRYANREGRIIKTFIVFWFDSKVRYEVAPDSLSSWLSPEAYWR